MLKEETMRRLVLAYTTGHLFDDVEFTTDAQRIVLVAKLIDKWIYNKDTNYRLLINHITIIENTFGETGLYAMYEYIGQYPECIEPMLSALLFMGKIPTPSLYDVELLQKLRELD